MTPPASLVEGSPPQLDVADVMHKARSENFSVASRLLPSGVREHLLAIYGYARLVDDIGDLAPGDRGAQLDWAEAELARTFENRATHPVFIRVGATARALDLAATPFVDLLAANRQDQVVDRYATFADLEAYCALSANPVGRLVLSVFGANNDETVPLADRICTGLQLVEHWQDVVEDHESGRIYIPLEDLRRFGVDETELVAGPANAAFRRLMAFEVGRARRLIETGRPLVSLLVPAGRLAIVGFIGGGLAQLDAIERTGFDVLAGPVKATKFAVGATSLSCLVVRRSRRR